MNVLRAGVGQEDITPPPGIRLSGYAGRTGPNTGCRDPLYASALYLDDGESAALILTLDVMGIAPRTDVRLRVLIGSELGMTADAVLVACSHTHAGPATIHARGTGDFEAVWTEEVLARAVRAAASARRDASAMTLRQGRGVCFAGINRRQAVSKASKPNQFCDPTCRVLLLERRGQPAAALVHYAMHPVTLGNDNRRVSADWVGAMRARMKQTLNCPVLFLQGCCGDINPRLCHGEQFCEAVGADVAGSALSCLDGLRSIENPRLHMGAAEAVIPLRPLPSEEELAQREQAARVCLAGADDETTSLFARDLAQADLEWAKACRDYRRHGVEPSSVTGRVSALSLGEIVLIGLPGEIFSEIGMDIEAAVPGAWTVGYTNGNLGYLYPDQALDEGGYEVELAYRLYGEQQADRGTADALIQSAIEAAQGRRSIPA